MIKKVTKNIIKKYINSNIFFSNFTAKYMSKKFNLLHRSSLPKTGGLKDGKIIDDHVFNSAGSEFQNNIKILNSNILKKCCSVAGFVPFLKGNTNIVLYNFFSKNYGIRKQLLTRICLCQGLNIIDTKWVLLHSNCVKRLLLKDWYELDADYISVEAFNPKIPKNHAGHDGQFRFWGLYGDGSATVHSSPTPNFMFPAQSFKAHRRYMPKTKKTQNNSIIATLSSLYGKKIIDDPKDISDFKNILSPVGYISLSEKSNKDVVKSIWHENAFDTRLFDKNYYLQVISFPPELHLDAVMIFSEAINKQENIIVHFFDINDKKLNFLELAVLPDTQVQLSEIFKMKNNNLSYVVVEFTDLENCSISGYVNFTYLINGFIGDSVHAHPVIGSDKLIRDNNVSKMGQTGNQCLKFMHFLPIKNADSYISIWGEEDKKMLNLDLFLKKVLSLFIILK